ncbi:MAG: 1-(5-phosphoribosyl)-5-[(5-phosphoribosylamino)methylideneamino]imidazole-4-carboxamide isomerase [Planctomycetaceae bacterium]|nr:1-(5-phosphoribosyl)-5-[(5-phosphoribosylamino)methylideneamino]imidazole-4-carboxamide isomerase [Planctomycetaceae bacterium]
MKQSLEIIPAIDLRGGRCVRLRQGDYDRETIFGDDPVAMAHRWIGLGGTRLHLVDLDGARDGIPANAEIVSEIVAAVDVPCQLGGGIRSQAAVRGLIEDIGIDRVIVGTGALKDPEWFRAMAGDFPQRVCLGLDARDSMVATEGWRDVSKTPALDLATGYADLPLAAVIYTNIAQDGMLAGIDPATLDDLRRIADLGLPVIASGGVTSIDDVRMLTELADECPGLIGVIVGRALYEGTLDLGEAIEVTRA